MKLILALLPILAWSQPALHITGAHTSPTYSVATSGSLPSSGCAIGEVAIVGPATATPSLYVNSTAGTCTWTALGSGTVTNSGTLTANAIVSGNGGVNITTPNTNATIDSSGNIVTPGTISGGTSGTAGSIKFYDSGGTNFTGWSAPTSLSGGCLLDIPAGDPAGQVLQFAAPSGGHCAGSWISAGGGASPYNPVSSVTWSTYGSTFTSITTTGSSFLVNETMTSVGSTPWFGRYFAVSGDWTHAFGANFGGIDWGGGLQVFGAFATDGTKIIECGPRVSNGLGYYTLFENWSGATSSALSAGPTQTNLVGKYQFGSQIYLQMSYASSTTTLVCSASFDGLRFIPLFTTTSPGFVPTGFGFSYNPDTATVNDWFSILGVN